MNFFRIIFLLILTRVTTLVYSQEPIRYVNCEKKDVDELFSILSNFEDIKIQEYLPSYINELSVNKSLKKVIYTDSLGVESFVFEHESPYEVAFCLVKIKEKEDVNKLKIRFLKLEEVHIVAQEYVIENNLIKEFIQYHIPYEFKKVMQYSNYYSFDGTELKVDFSPYVYESIPAFFMADLESYEREGDFKKVVTSKGKISLFKGGELVKELTPIKADLFQLNYFDKKGNISRHKLIEIDTTGKAVLRFDTEQQFVKINNHQIQISYDMEERIIDSVFTSKSHGTKIILQKRYNPSGLFEENQTVSRSGKTLSYNGILYNYPAKGFDEIQVNDSTYLKESVSNEKGSVLYNKKSIEKESPINFKNVFQRRSKATIYIVRNSINYGLVDENGNYLVELQSKMISTLNDTTLLITNNYKFDTLPLNGRKYGGMIVSNRLDLSDRIVRENGEIKFLLLNMNRDRNNYYSLQLGVFDVKKETWLFQPYFNWGRVYNNKFILSSNNRTILYDQSKNILLDSIHTVNIVNDSIMIYGKNHKFGIRSNDKLLIPLEYDQIYPYFDSIVMVKEGENYFLNTKNLSDLIYFEKPSGHVQYGYYVFKINGKLGYIELNYTSPVDFDYLFLENGDDYSISLELIFYKQENQFGVINKRHQRIDLNALFEKFE